MWPARASTDEKKENSIEGEPVDTLEKSSVYNYFDVSLPGSNYDLSPGRQRPTYHFFYLYRSLSRYSDLLNSTRFFDLTVSHSDELTCF